MVVVISFLLASCTKNKSLEGKYTGVFTGTYFIPYQPNEQTIIRSYTMEISNASKTRCEFILSYEISEMSINKKEISGSFETPRNPYGGINTFPTPISMVGTIEKVGGDYQITGKFTSTNKVISQQDSTFYYFPVEGTFIMTEE